MISVGVRRPFLRAALVLLVSGSAVLGVSGAPAARADVSAAGPTASTVTVVGESGDYVLDNASDQWRAGPDRISAGRLYSDGVSVNAQRGTAISDQSDYFTLDFRPPANQSLTAGVTYTDAQRSPFNTGTHPGIDVTGNSRGCNNESGQFTVLDLAPDLSRLWIVYEDHCEAGVPAVFGEIRYNEPVDSPDEVVAPSQISWPQQFVGLGAKRVPVIVTNTGAAPLAVSGLSVGGPNAADFSPGAVAPCATVAVGASCSLDVGFTPSAVGTRTATLTLADSTGSHAIAVSGTGVAPKSTVSIFGELGEEITLGAPHAWWDGAASITAQALSPGGVKVVAGPGPTASAQGTYTFEFAAAPNQTLTTGTYSDAQEIPSQAVGHPGMDVSGDSRGCGTAAGHFSVLDMAPDYSRLWIVFEHQCIAGGPASFGEIRYNEPALNPEVLVTPTRIDWPTDVVDVLGPTVPVTLINTGKAPLTVSAASVTGAASVDYAPTVSSTCTALAVNGSCAISMGHKPTQAGPRPASLAVSDTSAVASETVALSGDGTAQPAVGALAATVTNGDAVNLSWRNPSGAGWVRTVVRGAIGLAPPASEFAGFPVYSGTDTYASTGQLNVIGSYAFTAFAEYADGAVVPTNLSVPNLTASLSLSRSQVTIGTSIVASGRILDAASRAPVPLTKVEILAYDPVAKTYAKAGEVTTDVAGNYTITLTPGRTYDYLAAAEGDSSHLGGVSGSVLGSVAPHVAVATSKSKIKHGKTVKIGVGVGPNLPGTEVDLQQYVGGRWKTVQHTKLGSKSSAAFTVKLSKKGTYSYRVQVAASSGLLSGTSSTVKIKAT